MGPTRRSYPMIYSRPRDTSTPEETELELLERRRRPRGRPRREPLTDHECDSLCSSRDDDVP
jgi:hypothetical protein